MAMKSFFSRIRSSFKLCRSQKPSNIPENLSPNPLFVDCQPKKPRLSFKHVPSFLGCGFRTHKDDLPESPPCKWDETPRRDYNSSICSDSDDELLPPPPPRTRHPITISISGDSDDELFTPPPPPPPTPTGQAITTSLADSGLCAYESDDEEEEEMVTLSLNRKRGMKKQLPSFPAERSKMEGGRSLLERCDRLPAEMTSGTELQPSTVLVLDWSLINNCESDDEEEEEMVTLSLNRKRGMKKQLPSFPAERSKMEGGRSLLERCDKLLAEMTSGTELQPSTVSVLDSSFSPSPVMKRSIDFKDELGEFDEDIWSPAISPNQSKCKDKSDDCDFVYISEILRASNYLPEGYDIFQWLEEQQYGNDTSGVSRLKRKLIYDTVSEILNRDREMPWWKVLSLSNSSIEKPSLHPSWKVLSLSNSSIEKPSLHQIWSEFQRIRDRDTGENLFDIVRKEVGDAISGWADCPVEKSEVALHIERAIFKDLVSETIGDLVASAGIENPRRVVGNWFYDAKGIRKPF